MNERIKQILKHSGAWDYYEINEGVEGDEAAILKFAELLIERCAKVAQHFTPDTEECEYTHLVSDKIKEHFGLD